jgi:peroxiredoxin
MSLQYQLDALKAEREANTPPHAILTRQRAMDQLLASGLDERVLHVGERPPSFRLRDGSGATFSSDNALSVGPVLIVFYRGRWCPYCNVDLAAIESASREIRSAGASIVAVSQQTPAESLQTVRLNGLSFGSLVDSHGRVANAFGLRWKAPTELRAVQEECGVDPGAFNGDAAWTLTMPARYIVGEDGTVAYADISVDYTQRGDPSELLPVLDRLRARQGPYGSMDAAAGRPKHEAPESVSLRPRTPRAGSTPHVHKRRVQVAQHRT